MMVLLIGLLIIGCSPRSKYERRLKHELKSGVRYDSLFLGLYLGMPNKDFYTECWKLNQKGIIKQGSNNSTVEYELREEFDSPVTINFYPIFEQDKIFEMPVQYIYNGWAPWNKTLSSDNLQKDVLKWYKKLYGNDFMEVEHPKRGKAYIKLDGNRRITIFKEDDMYVWAIFTDMLVKTTISDSPSTRDKMPEELTKEFKD